MAAPKGIRKLFTVIAHRWKKLKLFDRDLIFYLAALLPLTLLFTPSRELTGKYWTIQIVTIAALLAIIPRLDRRNSEVLRLLRYGYILLTLPFLYWYTGPLIHLVFQQEFDALVIQAERFMFGELPNLRVQHYVNPSLTEVMQIAYATYWLTIPLGAIIFYWKRQFDLLEHLLHGIMVVFIASFALFILFPVAGPRFYLTDQIQASYDSLYVGQFLRTFVSTVAFRGGAFPSLHVAVAVFILVFMEKFRPKTALFLFLPLVTALSLSTIYGQYHYVLDVLAGLVLGLGVGLWTVERVKQSFPLSSTG